MTYLLDTKILSETSQDHPNQHLVDWMRRFEPHLATADPVFGEIEYGISLLADGPRRSRLDAWRSEILRRFGTRIFRFDTQLALAWGRYRAEWQQAGVSVPFIDGMIAATARFHGLTVATRNVADFENTGCEVTNPFGPV